MSPRPDFQAKTMLLRQRRGLPATVGHGATPPEVLCGNTTHSGCVKNQSHNVGFKATPLSSQQPTRPHEYSAVDAEAMRSPLD